jgi:hypothetical protein
MQAVCPVFAVVALLRGRSEFEGTVLKYFNILQTPWPLFRKRTVPTERPPLVFEVSANFLG